MDGAPLQLSLFKRLPVPRGAVQWKPPARTKREPPPPPPQLEFGFVLRELVRDDDTEFDFPAHAVVPASSASIPLTTAPRSVFDLAAASKALKSRGRFGAPEQFSPSQYRVERDAGTVRVVRIRHDETPEWREREIARRAKQRPPKPPKQRFKMKKSRVFDDKS